MLVTPSASMASRTAPGSVRGIITSVAPIEIKLVTAPVPAIVYTGASSRNTSVVSTYLSYDQEGVVDIIIARWVTITPLGTLSVPLVYITIARSFSSTKASGISSDTPSSISEKPISPGCGVPSITTRRGLARVPATPARARSAIPGPAITTRGVEWSTCSATSAGV